MFSVKYIINPQKLYKFHYRFFSLYKNWIEVTRLIINGLSSLCTILP